MADLVPNHEFEKHAFNFNGDGKFMLAETESSFVTDRTRRGEKYLAF